MALHDAAAVVESTRLDEANDALHALGVRTELDSGAGYLMTDTATPGVWRLAIAS